MKIFRWISDNILFLITLFLLVFIPLYPKKPILNVVNTWVYIRAEDFVVLLVLFVWVVQLLRKKITLKTPLTMPILLFWIIGSIATIHGVLLIFPGIANVFPNVAFLSFLRRIEYISLFFVAYSGLKDKKSLPIVVAVLALTLLGVVAYGMGQKYLGFPAYLTMNEEFAKGAPIQLSALSRVPSTFGGHYDLAAYLVLIIPVLASMIFAFRNWFVKLFLLLTISSGFVLLFMTVSRVSFFVLFISLFLVLFLHKKRWVVYSLPIIGIIVAFLFLYFSPRLLDRFGNTVKEVDVLVDTKTGEALGNLKEVTPSDFTTKVVKKRVFHSREDISSEAVSRDEELQLATTSAIVQYEDLPAHGVLFIPPNASTGESLPQGTGYINLSLSPVKHKFGEFFYETKNQKEATKSADVYMFTGEFLVKRASAYDLSFTTRFQGEWPRALDAFKRNVLFGSGYSSVSLAVDNSYLRMLGEVGSLGFISFLAIFMTAIIYIRKILPEVDSRVVRSFVFGVSAGVLGLMLNATLIDVFEASKVAFYLWLLIGITIGVLHSYQKTHIDFYKELKKVAASTPAIITLLGVTILTIFSPIIDNYFVGDDFTWLRWAADCGSRLYSQCPSIIERISQYFIHSDGFFYRPGTKTYFLLMYKLFWLNPTAYHIVTLSLHVIIVGVIFLLVKKILKDFKLAVLSAFFFVILSGYSESVFWIASTGHLVSVLFTLLSLLFFILWEEKKRVVYFIASFVSIAVSLLFYELGIVAPFLILLYKFVTDDSFLKNLKEKKVSYMSFFLLVGLYLFIRFLAQSHWSGGDYSYNLSKLPFNIVGNSIGYFLLSLLGPVSLRFYEVLRNFSKVHLLFSTVIILILASVIVFLRSKMKLNISKEDRKIITFSVIFMFISLLPFLGLGNIAPRYSYLSSFGFVILLAFFIKKLYSYLLSNGRDIAAVLTSLIVSIFFLLHIIQVQQIHGDWHEAGIRVNRFFVSVEETFSDYWTTEPMELNFVKVPIRTGEAWIFPVGLDDALWFIFKNPQLHVHNRQSVKEALDSVNNPRNEKVLIFDESGSVTERQKKLQIE